MEDIIGTVILPVLTRATLNIPSFLQFLTILLLLPPLRFDPCWDALLYYLRELLTLRVRTWRDSVTVHIAQGCAFAINFIAATSSTDHNRFFVVIQVGLSQRKVAL